MKKVLLFTLFLVSYLYGQTDTASVFIYNLPAKTRIDSSYILITESPTTTYKVTWKNLMRSLNYYKLLRTTTLDNSNDLISITHRDGVNDTTKGITIKQFYVAGLKDSVTTSLGILETEINTRIDSLGDTITAQLNLKASIQSVNDLTDSVDTAFAWINLRATKAELADSVGNLRDSLYVALELKASVSQYNALSDSMNTAYADILLEAGTRDSVDNVLWAALTLKVAKDSVISFINLTPEMIKISANKIELDGDVIADSLFGKLLVGATIATDTTGQRVVLDGAQNDIRFYDVAGVFAGRIFGDTSSVYGTRLTFYTDLGYFINDLLVGGNLWVDGGIEVDGGHLEINTTGQMIRVNNVPALGNTGHVLRSDGTSFTPAILQYSDLGSIPSSFTPASHGNEKHTSAFLTEYTETDPHVYSWARAISKPSYNFEEIGNLPSEYPAQSHGNEKHSSVFITTAGLIWDSISGKPSTYAPASHNNTAHSETYITSSALSGYAQYSAAGSWTNTNSVTKTVTTTANLLNSEITATNATAANVFRAVRGIATQTNNDDCWMYGIYGEATGGGINYGGYFTATASGSGNTAYGVYASVSLSTGANGYALYSNGDFYLNGAMYGADATTWNGKSVVTLGASDAQTFGGHTLTCKELIINGTGTGYFVLLPDAP